ncbi:NAD(P)-dependent alcohol dehydrogenase [Oceanobacillus bengalensis]|uniref:NAD(P)-dependent alcohol dehydrogenase n=1 Tax=Oceanobacillus bengalensis TaxID=1435466 RepID=A0A494YS82_9BACI|nr:NAD(P)-dependent alcohol dehydrogenase [Oceanobacillus bengalensis]RKQ12764.1 NAD(P)-dependent alcohol dehydrogenase [Oceanobacillus bengalensis]
MKAIVSEKYGTPDTLKLSEVATPEPKENQVLVRVHAASINYGNLVLLTGKPLLARLAFGLTKPKYPIPGGDMAGIVEVVGANVTQFQVGDEVYGDLSSSSWGAFAEYVVADEGALALKPSNLSFTEAAAVPMAATTALQAIRDKGRPMAGQDVLIHGASGGVGTFAVQIAKAFGAKVTALVSTRNVDIARSLGADNTIDYKKDDFEKLDDTYDLIIGVNGARPITSYKRKLKENGVFVQVGGESSQMFQTMMQVTWLSMTGKKKFVIFMQKANQNDLVIMKELIEEGKVKPVIDRSYSLNEVPEAIQYFEKGHSQGKVVITM